MVRMRDSSAFIQGDRKLHICYLLIGDQNSFHVLHKLLFSHVQFAAQFAFSLRALTTLAIVV